MRKLISIAALGGAVFAGSQMSQAAIYYEKSTANNNTDLNVVGNYSLNPDGSGGSPSAAQFAAGQISLNGYAGGTGSNAYTFNGASLDLAGGTLNLRNGNGFTKTFTAIIGTGNSLITANTGANPGTILSVGTFTANSGSTTTFQQLNGSTTSTLSDRFTVTTITGSGDIALDATGAVSSPGSRTLLFTATNANAFTGNFTWSTAHPTNLIALQFGNNLVSGGGLIASGTATSGARINLDHNVTFASLTLNGTSLAAGTYTFAQLNSSYDTIFVDGGSGSITVVPEPSVAVLGLTSLVGCCLSLRRRA